MNGSEEFNVGRSAWRFAVVAALTLVAANAFAGQITLYERSGFQGQSLTTATASQTSSDCLLTTSRHRLSLPTGRGKPALNLIIGVVVRNWCPVHTAS